MKKFIALLLILSITIFSSNISCYAENSKNKSNESSVSNNVNSYTTEKQKQIKESLRSALLELSKDKKFMDSLKKNYNDTSNKPTHSSTLQNIKKLSFGSLQWALKKVINFFIKILGICIGITAAGLILFHFAEKIIKSIPGHDLFFKLLLKFSPGLVGDGKSGQK